jgi:hypothetical protein
VNLRDLQERRNLDLRVLSDMRCDIFDFEAYSTIVDLERRQRQITDPNATNASKYRFIFDIQTLTGPDSFSSHTEVGVDTDVPDYPYQAPRTWILSKPLPWSPSFMPGAPVYIGPGLWSIRGEHNTLGHLALHICYLLNWDQRGRSTGYPDWCAAAIKHHEDTYGTRPINADLTYPILPAWLNAPAPLHYSFQINASDSGHR